MKNNTPTPIIQIEAIEPGKRAAALLPGWLDYLRTAKPAVSTTLPPLDSLLGGLHGLVVMGGGPGTGKTALAIQIGATYASGGGPVIYLAYEQGPAGYFSRIMQRETGIAPKDQAEALQGPQAAALAAQVEAAIQAAPNLTLQGLPQDGAPIDPQGLRGQVEALQLATGLPCLVIVDSLHYTPLGEAAAGMDGKRAIDAALHIFSQLSQDTRCTVLAIAHQTKGEVSGRDNGLMAFSGSGTIAYAADMAIQLTRAWGKDSAGTPLGLPPGQDFLRVSVPKNRMGAIADGIEVVYNLVNQTFE